MTTLFHDTTATTTAPAPPDGAPAGDAGGADAGGAGPTPPPPDARRRGDDLPVVGFVAALAAVVIALVAVGLGLRAVDEADSGTAAPAAPAPAEALTVEVELGDLFVRPSSIEVAAGTEVIVAVTNTGAVPHDLKLDGVTGTEMIEPGGRATASLGVVDESSQAWCTVPGHKEGGMVLAIEVTGEAPASSSAGTAAPSKAAAVDFSATAPAAFTPYDPTLRPAPGGSVHDVTLRATEKVLEVAPGVEQEVWTFNDQYPGPVLRGKVGDVFNVTLVNEGELGHSIDFHASKVAWNDEMRTIQPGESLVYQFEAKHAGVFMYHCGTAPALHHIGNGMFGAIVIDPPDLAPVDHEYLLVQSELYLGPDGEPGDLGKMQREEHDAVVFNGYVNQYRDRPIRVEPGQRIRVWVLDGGPSENSSFHVVGTVFDTVFKEGGYALRPGPGRGGAQALDLQPSQGGFVELTFDEPGLYPIVTHKFANVGKGALGLFQAGEVAAGGGARH